MINKHFYLAAFFCALLNTFGSFELNAQQHAVQSDSTHTDTTSVDGFVPGSRAAILQAQFRAEKMRDSIRIAQLDSINKIYQAHLATLQDSVDAYALFKDSLFQHNAEEERRLAAIKYQAYLDSLPTQLYRDFEATQDSIDRGLIPMKRLTNTGYYRMFLPAMLYRDKAELTLKDSLNTETMQVLGSRELVSDAQKASKWTQKQLQLFYSKYPELVGKTQDEIDEIVVFEDNIQEESNQKAHVSVVDLFKPVNDPIPSPTEERAAPVIQRPNFWKKGGDGSLQFTQNYISDNWYKGGESTNLIMGTLKLFANYNDKQKVQWENLFEAKLGYNTQPSDTVHKYRVNTDLLRITSKIGLQANKRWYYTLSGEINTQFCRNYDKNSNNLKTAFLSPVNVILGLGMDYKVKKKTLTLSSQIFPLTYSMRHVNSDRVNETKFGLKEGETTMHTFGSTFKTTMSWKIASYIKLDSRLNCFSNYDHVEANWENTFNFILNKHLSTKLFVHARFDDGVKKEDTYFQLNELLSFGLNYSW